MNKTIYLALILSFFLTACSSQTSWEQDTVSELSNRIMADHIQVAWTLEQEQSSSSETLIQLKITKDDGSSINTFDLNHEKLLHLIIISKDLSYFNHVHPEYKGNGVFEITNDFPMGGDYRLIADFKPTDGDAVTKLEWVHVQGEQASSHPIELDTSLEKTVDDKIVELAVNNLEAKKETTLTFSFTDQITGQPINDLEPYLGAIGHVVILSEDGNIYVHVHAEEDQGSGPKALFETEFPSSGIYKIWGQFQKDNEVFTASFVVHVSE